MINKFKLNKEQKKLMVTVGTLFTVITIMLCHFQSSTIFMDKASLKQNIPRIQLEHDQDQDGIKDLEDILEGAREDARNRPVYRSVYYRGGYPPDNEGVCTDVVWRAFKNAGYDLKKLVDEDISNNVRAYPRVGGKPDPNIDFRRVPNLKIFFDRKATVLITAVIPNNSENLKQWQAGDIVVFGKPIDHIGILSDIRRRDGVPYLIHNGGPYTKEEDMLIDWDQNISPIIGHYRWPKAARITEIN